MPGMTYEALRSFRALLLIMREAVVAVQVLPRQQLHHRSYLHYR